MVGIVLYAYDGKSEWILNNVHCKSGYIILKKTKNIIDIQSNYGQVHGKCYKSVFKQDVDKKVVGAGFAYVGGEWKFNSYSFNCGSGYHDENRGMNNLERQFIQVAIQNYAFGLIRNTLCSDIRKRFKGYCQFGHDCWK